MKTAWIFFKDKMNHIQHDEVADFLSKCKGLGLAESIDLDEKPANKQEKVSPTDMMVRVGALYGRKATTQWSKKEEKAYRDIGSITAEDVKMIERYHVEMKKQPEDKAFHRRDLITLLNNWSSELDRAREYKYTPVQDIAAGIDIKIPEGWVLRYEEKLGHSGFQQDWSKITPLQKNEIINEMRI